jgi:AraC-like DNA-binding protein
MEELYYIGIVQTIFSLLLISKSKELTKADYILLLFIVFMGLEFLYSLANDTFFPQLPDFIIIPFTFGPLLFLYTSILIKGKLEVGKDILIHVFPFFLFLALALMFDTEIINKDAGFGELGGVKIIHVINHLSYIAVSLFYWIKIKNLIKNHKKSVREIYSEDSKSLGWLDTLSVFTFGGFILFVALDLLLSQLGYHPFKASLLLDVSMVLAIYSISFFGFRQEVIYEDERFELFLSCKKSKVESKVETQEVEENLSKDELILKQIIKLMEEDKVYLNRLLSLQDIASYINVPAYRLSKIINEHLNKNFFTVINEYRINEVKNRIKSGEYDNYTLSAIGYDSGFNSKSSFHALFKKYTGVTPSQYRKKHHA